MLLQLCDDEHEVRKLCSIVSDSDIQEVVTHSPHLGWSGSAAGRQCDSHGSRSDRACESFAGPGRAGTGPKQIMNAARAGPGSSDSYDSS
jgi:hypothetical protein